MSRPGMRASVALDTKRMASQEGCREGQKQLEGRKTERFI